MASRWIPNDQKYKSIPFHGSLSLFLSLACARNLLRDEISPSSLLYCHYGIIIMKRFFLLALHRQSTLRAQRMQLKQ